MSLIRSSLSLISFPVSTRSFSVVPTSLALLTSCLILLCISSTSSLFSHSHRPSYFLLSPPSGSSLLARGNNQRFRPLARSPPGILPRSREGENSSFSVRVGVAETDNRSSQFRGNGMWALSGFWGFPDKKSLNSPCTSRILFLFLGGKKTDSLNIIKMKSSFILQILERKMVLV